MTDKRKSIAILKAEYDEYRKNYGKTFVHNKSGEKYQLLYPAFCENTNAIQMVYGLCAMSWLKSTMPPDEFFNKFTELGKNIEKAEANSAT